MLPRYRILQLPLSFSKAENNSGAEAEITLAVVAAVQELRVQVFGLRQSNAEVVFYFPVQTAAGAEVKSVAVAERRQTCAQWTAVERACGVSSAE